MQERESANMGSFFPAFEPLQPHSFRQSAPQFHQVISSPFGVSFFGKKNSNFVNYGTIMVGFFKIQYYDFICLLYYPKQET